ncbi:small-conductance mechanosensitive channel [Psychromonas sp. CNPT3]|uniref:mechanosensitive ion channel family protein n=1 Tax=Psychromonas sp. CNPT3 TaxID=314282 RepID=UPI00006E5887|nr:mechanosensitive ion channel family protein [Psychromonas sp. CNPT3]AGH80394.1 small-conductance mechanosensitive channel [Psychromonas sp. CNPT3]
MIEAAELYLQNLLISLNIDNWILNVVLVFVIAFVLLVTWRSFAKKTEKIIARTVNNWDDIAWFAIYRPMNWLIISMGISMGLRILADKQHISLVTYFPTMQQIAILFLIFWAFWRLAKKAESTFVALEDKDTTTVVAMAKLGKLSIWVIFTLALIQTLGVSISGLLAFGGMGGIVVGMAGKDLLSNLFGALMIYLDKPFRVGDWIRSPDKAIEGTVEDIGWRVTRIRTFDKRPLYVPNSLFTQIVVENPSRMSNRRIKETFGLRYCDIEAIPQIIKSVREMLEKHPEIDDRQTIIVNFDFFNQSSLDFFIYTFTKTTNWVRFHEIKQDVLLKVADIVAQNDAEFAVPVRQLHFDMPSGAPLS